MTPFLSGEPKNTLECYLDAEGCDEAGDREEAIRSKCDEVAWLRKTDGSEEHVTGGGDEIKNIKQTAPQTPEAHVANLRHCAKRCGRVYREQNTRSVFMDVLNMGYQPYIRRYSM